MPSVKMNFSSVGVVGVDEEFAPSLYVFSASLIGLPLYRFLFWRQHLPTNDNNQYTNLLDRSGQM